MSRSPIVLIANWAMSVIVTDHMPPIVEYNTTMEPPRMIATTRGSSNRPLKMVEKARVEGTVRTKV